MSIPRQSTPEFHRLNWPIEPNIPFTVLSFSDLGEPWTPEAAIPRSTAPATLVHAFAISPKSKIHLVSSEP